MNDWCRIFSVIAAIACQAADADEIRPEHVMYSDPELPPAPVDDWTIDATIVPLWQELLRGSEADLQRQAADSIARAHQLGAPGLDTAVPELERLAADPEAHHVARAAACRALVILDSRGSAEMLAGVAAGGGTDLRMIVEPGLARWNYEPLHEVWLRRVGDPQTNRRELLLAVSALEQNRVPAALPELLRLVASPGRPPDLRLAAAGAAGAIAHEGLEAAAHPLLQVREGAGSLINRLCAVRLLAHHQSDEAQTQLAQLARDSDPAVAAAALGSLFAIDPALVLPHVEWALANPDPSVRQRGLDTYITLPTPERVSVLAVHLDDVHPQLRRGVCVALAELADRPELRTEILAAGEDVLNAESWRGQEQAALLLGTLNHTPVAGRMVDLLESEREEVMVASAWALGKFSLPETLPALLDRAERYASPPTTPPSLSYSHVQAAHLFETLGRLRYQPAEPLLRKYVPKNGLDVLARSAAIWGLGYLHAEDPDPELIAELIERLNDVDSFEPEVDEVREMCAVSLGRMHAEQALPSFQRYLGEVFVFDTVLLRIRWAQMEITGEDWPLPIAQRHVLSNWFIERLAD